ncbi:MAG TPA: DUF5602 domain-containing protein [Azospirillum sp.]|nr:DUF5602 domain-containing protein [Azospirillum sp.]
MLIRTILVAGAFAMAASSPAQAQNLDKAPPGGSYKKVSELVKLPDFLPGMGTLYVDPKTLPAGPFLAYDHDGRLASTIYMVPVEDIQGQKKLDNLKAAGGKVDHVDMYFNAGHPGVEKPHYHIVLWHIAEADEARVAK